MEDRLQQLLTDNEAADVVPDSTSPSAVAIVRFVKHQVSRCPLGLCSRFG